MTAMGAMRTWDSSVKEGLGTRALISSAIRPC
jgi:hypothetical protein